MTHQRIRDPLHDLIQFDTGKDEFENVLWRVIQTRPFQRLRRIKQLGFSDLVYPGATHSRFAHSVGVFFTARRLMNIIRRHVGRPEELKVQRALAAALVHDVGHGPFSHAFETVGKRLDLALADHEHVSDRLIRSSGIADVLNELGGGFADDVADIIHGAGKKTVYRAVVSSQFDADRLDYIRRDRLMTGTQAGAIDFEWLLANLEIAELPYGVDQESVGKVETFVLGPKAIYSAESFVLGLFQLYPTVYFHKATRSAEKMFAELLSRIVRLVRDGSIAATGLAQPHPLARFAKNPESVDDALSLDDTVVWGALPLLADARDRTVSQFSRRLRDRELYKCIDLRVPVAHAIDPPGNSDPASVTSIDKVCAAIKEGLSRWSSKNRTDMPRVLVDEAQRSPYKTVEESSSLLDRINIRTSDGDLVDLQQRSNVVAALKPFKLCRAYVDGGDTDARKAVDEIIAGEIGKWKKTTRRK